MTIQEAQVNIDKWIKEFGVRYFDDMTNLAILMEEVGELARLYSRKFGEQSFKNKEAEMNIDDEMADILFVLICMANQNGINLEEALIRNLQKKSERDSTRHRNNEKLK